MATQYVNNLPIVVTMLHNSKTTRNVNVSIVSMRT